MKKSKIYLDIKSKIEDKEYSLNDSLNLIFRFIFLCMFLFLGSAIIDLLPNALGPHSDLP